MRDYDLDPLFDLPCIPGLALGRIDACTKNRCSNAFVIQNSFESGSDIVFARVNSEDLASSSFSEFLPDFIDESPFFRIQPILREVTCFRDNKSNIALEFRIELCAIESSQVVGMVGIEQQGVKHRAQ